ncbi:hypothetical protein EOE67_19290 [Rheinheimera riviphila]|uniref:Peptidase S9 prolyl oligopeptidase catalytic domain-containing protein n=1 Tax=Rheinheimera riviphila TaxID=1834037 RepID=A0A437QBS3_9GAMM|nr:alpha/beta fold hydrolase [Rheinheimera riviphila]RVU32002.1 hypothetical protein EOE67_19290 [Rheinheimera riviphila]
MIAKKLQFMILGLLSILTQSVAVANPIPATELFREATISQLQFSPGGRHISAFINQKNRKGLALYNRKTNDFQLIALVAKIDWVRQYRWLDHNNLYLVSGRDNSWIHSIVQLQQTDGNISAVVTAVPANGYLVGQLKGYPPRLLFAHDAGRKDAGFDLYQLSIEQLLARQFPPANLIQSLTDSASASALIYDPETNRLISVRWDQDTRLIDVKYRELQQKQWLPLFSYNPTDFSFLPMQFLSADSLAVLSDKNSDKVALYRFDITNQQIGDLLFEHPRYDLIGADFYGDQLASVSYLAHGRLEQQFFVTAEQQLHQGLSAYFPEQQWIFVDSEADWHLVLVFSATNPGQYYLYQSGQKPKFIGEKLPALADYSLASTVKLESAAADGLLIESLLTLPAKKNNEVPPLVVMPHGGPIGVQDTDDFEPTVQFLASRGYAVLRINFRGSRGYGKSFKERGIAELGAGIEQDITRAVTQVVEKYGITRTCAMGYSYGGYSAMMLAMHQPQQYRCVIAGFGIYDLPLLFNASNLKVLPEQQKRVERVVGPMHDGLRERSPVYKAQLLQAPVLLIAGMDDDTTGFEQSHRMFDALKRAGKSVQPMFYQDTGHGHDRWDLEHHQIGLIEQFLDQHLAIHATSSITEQAEQWYRQAELLATGEKLAKDLPAAMQLYQQVAATGHSGAMVELARAAIYGEGLPQDLQKGVKYLREAAANKNSTAELMLGLLYSAGLHTQPDLPKSNQHFRNAAKLYSAGTATLYLARATCLGWAQAVDWHTCLNAIEQHLLAHQQHFSDPHSRLLQETSNSIVARLLIEGQPGDAERHRLIGLLQRALAKPIDISAEVSGYRHGLYEGTGVKYENASSYPLNTSLDFGSALKIDRSDDSTGNVGTWLLVRWQRKLSDGTIQLLSDKAMMVRQPSWLRLHNTLNSAPDKKSAAWMLQVFDLKGQNLYQQEFVFQ